MRTGTNNEEHDWGEWRRGEYAQETPEELWAWCGKRGILGRTEKIQKSRSTIREGGDVPDLSPFLEGTARKQPLPETYLTNPLVK